MSPLQSMQETLKVRQANLDALHAAHRTLVRDSLALEATVPEVIELKVKQVDADWLVIQELMAVVRTRQQQQLTGPQQEMIVERTAEPIAGMSPTR